MSGPRRVRTAADVLIERHAAYIENTRVQPYLADRQSRNKSMDEAQAAARITEAKAALALAERKWDEATAEVAKYNGLDERIANARMGFERTSPGNVFVVPPALAEERRKRAAAVQKEKDARATVEGLSAELGC